MKEDKISIYHHLNCMWFRFYFWLIDVDSEKRQGFVCQICGRYYPPITLKGAK